MVKIKSSSLILLATIILGISIAIVLNINPLSRSKQHIRKDILSLTPLGMDMKEVIEIIESKREWSVMNIIYDGGYINYDEKIPGWPTSSLSKLSVIGEKCIIVYLGYYGFIRTDVTASWGFDKDSKLIDVYVRKSMDVI